MNIVLVQVRRMEAVGPYYPQFEFTFFIVLFTHHIFVDYNQINHYVRAYHHFLIPCNFLCLFHRNLFHFSTKYASQKLLSTALVMGLSHKNRANCSRLIEQLANQGLAYEWVTTSVAANDDDQQLRFFVPEKAADLSTDCCRLSRATDRVKVANNVLHSIHQLCVEVMVQNMLHFLGECKFCLLEIC